MWTASRGIDGNWLGGPSRDASGDDQGGYAFFETSTLPGESDGVNIGSAMLESPVLQSTGAAGTCLKFFYAAKGLSVDRLRILLHPIDMEMMKKDAPADHRDDIVLWTSMDNDGMWRSESQLYTFPHDHSIVFEAIPMKGEERKFRGYVAIDNVGFSDGVDCTGHCTFDGGFCNWEQDERDDFQWTLSRGSDNPKTGPIRDRSSLLFGGTAGGYAYIDSKYPRRPGDQARLFSPSLSETAQGDPLCLRFWTHMHGPGVGALRIMRQSADAETELWSLSGPAGNQWYQGQVPVPADSEFRLILVAEVGAVGLGDIAIDDVSLTEGVCPLLPQAAAEASNDCTFEVDECGWQNPDRREALDQIDWERTTARQAKMPQTDHTMRSERGHIALLSYREPQRSGDTGWLVSPPLTPATRCLTFWYYMDEPVISATGPQLGGLKVWIRSMRSNENSDTVLKPVWSVTNAQGPQWMHGQTTIAMEKEHQVVFEGMWGGTTSGAVAIDDITFIDGQCQQKPMGSHVMSSDCDFTRGACDWSNSTSDSAGQQQWRVATLLSRPRGLPDHTFRTPTGYVYFDIFSPQGRRLKLRLVAPVTEPGRGQVRSCISFWFAAMSPTDAARLRIIRQAVSEEDDDKDNSDSSESEMTVWSLTAADTDVVRPTWQYGQVDVDAASRFRIIVEGDASNFGFAIDDVRITPGMCRLRPSRAEPQRERNDEENEMKDE